MVFGFQGKNTGLNLHPNCGQKGLDRPDREKIYKLLEESASKDWQALAYHEDRRKYKQALAVTYKKILALIPNTEQIEELRAELKNVMAQRDLTWRELEEVKKIKGEQIDAMLVEARRTAKKVIIKELEKDLVVTHNGFGITISMPHIRWEALGGKC